MHPPEIDMQEGASSLAEYCSGSLCCLKGFVCVEVGQQVRPKLNPEGQEDTLYEQC